jgi:hypothetical protein
MHDGSERIRGVSTERPALLPRAASVLSQTSYLPCSPGCLNQAAPHRALTSLRSGLGANRVGKDDDKIIWGEFTQVNRVGRPGHHSRLTAWR